jgi:hypothetical protein
MKIMRFDDTVSEKDKQNAISEINFLATVNHPNVIAYKAAFFD